MHLMHDFETLDIMPTALPLTLGMVWFDPRKSDVESAEEGRLYIKFDYDQLRKIGGFTESNSTHAWWDKQTNEARTEAFAGERTNVFLAAGQIVGFMSRHHLDGLWGNGAAFDNAILRHFFARIHQHITASEGYSVIPSFFPPYKVDRCYRTLRSMHHSLHPVTEQPEFIGVEHNALDDAVHQARYAQRMMQNMGIYQD